ncbi:MAG TPA: SLC13 family permease, partial [Chitinophagales bacterium]|nr:SLC13 family permease [Chitinophagales bacterium]
IGSDYHKILFGLMLATYLISMWVSNTATTMMMLPTTLAVIARIEELTGQRNNKIGVAMLLGIAYAASIGGTATLVGTPPNLIFLSQFKAAFPYDAPVSFLQWSLFGIPFSFGYLLICYILLVFLNMKGKMNLQPHHHDIFKKELESLGKMTFEEKTVTILFSIMAILWFSRADIQIGSTTVHGWSSLMPHPDFFQDGTVAIFMATLLFLIPSKSKKGEMLMDWESAKKLPFGIILLFGGGFALAKGFSSSGLADWLGMQMHGIGALPDFLIILVICIFMTYLSELASNVAITQLMLPVLAAVAVGADIPPLLLMIPATIAASFGFMLPVATAPNTIIFTGEKLTVKDMLKAGFWLDISGILWLTVMMNLFGRWVFGM